MADKLLDVRGLGCPIPVLKAKSAIKQVPKGGTLEILSTDPGAPADFEAFCYASGHSLLESGASEGVYRFVIRNNG